MSRKDPNAVVEAVRILQDAPRALLTLEQQLPRELSPAEILSKPTQTLAKIITTLDKFVCELSKRADEGSIGHKDVRSFVEVVKAHSALRQTQLAEDQFARQSQAVATDADVAALLIEAVKAGGDSALTALKEAINQIEATSANEKQLSLVGKSVAFGPETEKNQSEQALTTEKSTKNDIEHY